MDEGQDASWASDAAWKVARLRSRRDRLDDEESPRPAARTAGDVLARQTQQRGLPRFGRGGRGRGGAGRRWTEHRAHRGQESLARRVGQPATVTEPIANSLESPLA